MLGKPATHTHKCPQAHTHTRVHTLITKKNLLSVQSSSNGSPVQTGELTPCLTVQAPAADLHCRSNKAFGHPRVQFTPRHQQVLDPPQRLCKQLLAPVKPPLSVTRAASPNPSPIPFFTVNCSPVTSSLFFPTDAISRE